MKKILSILFIPELQINVFIPFFSLKKKSNKSQIKISF